MSILSKLPSENPCIDYKVIAYTKDNYYEFIKDVVAFLNCEEKHNTDRYIIIGVKNSKERIGILPEMPQMPDDCEFQHLIDMIRPRPFVNTGVVKYDGMSFGYIHIARENDDCTYEVARNYPESTHMVHEGQAFIRLGSTKKVMTQEDRHRLESKTYSRFSGASPLMIPQESEKKRSSLSALMIASLIGTWDEHYEGDREVIQQFSGMPYEKWIIEFQQRQGNGDETVVFSQGKWCFAEHEEYLKSNARAIFDEHIDLLFHEMQIVFMTYDPRFELPGDERYCAALHKKDRYYSEILYSSLAKKLAMVANSTELFTNCSSSHISKQAYLVVESDLAPENWTSYNVRKKRKKTNKGAERRWQERTSQSSRSSSSYGK